MNVDNKVGSVQLNSAKPLPESTNEPSNFIKALEILASKNIAVAIGRLRLAHNIPSSDLWTGYEIVLQAALNLKNDKLQTLSSLADIVADLLSKPEFCCEAIGKNPLLVKHIQNLIDNDDTQIAKLLLTTLIEKGILNPAWESTASLWVQVSTQSMNSVETGMESFAQALQLSVGWDNATYECLEGFCHKLLVTLEKDASISAAARSTLDRFLGSCCAVSCHEEITQRLWSNDKRDKPNIVSKQFTQAVYLTGMKGVESFVEQRLATLLETDRLGPACCLLAHSLSLDPVAISKETIFRTIHQLMIKSRQPEFERNQRLISMTLKDPNVAKYIPEMTKELIEQTKPSDVEGILKLLISYKIPISAESQKLLFEPVRVATWEQIDNDRKDCGRYMIEAISHKLLTYHEFVAQDPELVIELASKYLGSGKYPLACEWLMSNQFVWHYLKQRDALFTKIIGQMIAEGEYEDVVKALSRFEESGNVRATLWEKLITEVTRSANRTRSDYDVFCRMLTLCPLASLSDELVTRCWDTAFKQNDSNTCFMLFDHSAYAFETLSKQGFPVQERMTTIETLHHLLNYLDIGRSATLLKMIKQDPNELFRGLLTSLDDTEKTLFFTKLVEVAAKTVKSEDDDAFVDILAFRQKIELYLIELPLIYPRFNCDVELGNQLARSTNMDLLVTGIDIAIDALSRMALIASGNPREVAKQWLQLVARRVKFPAFPTLLPEIPLRELPALPPDKAVKSMASKFQDMLEKPETQSAFSTMIQRLSDPDVVISASQAKVIAKLWPSIKSVEVSTLDLVKCAAKVADAGEINHLQFFQTDLDVYLRKLSPKEPMTEQDKDALFGALELLVHYNSKTDHEGSLSNTLSNAVVKAKFSEAELMKLWDVYLSNAVHTSSDVHLKQVMTLLKSKLPALIKHSPKPTEEKPIPNAAETGLTGLLRSCSIQTPKELLKLQKAFFEALPRTYYKDMAQQQMPGADYSIALRFAEKILTNSSETEAAVHNARVVVCGVLTRLLNSPEKSEAVCKTVREFVCTFIEQTSCIPSKNAKPEVGTALGLWKIASETGILNGAAYGGALHTLMATGKLPVGHPYTGADLIKLYAHAIQVVSELSKEGLALAYSLTLEIKKDPHFEEHKEHLIPAILALGNNNREMTLANVNNRLAADVLFDLQKELLLDLPLEVRVEALNKLVEILRSTGYNSITRHQFMSKASIITQYRPTPTTRPATEKLVEVLKYGIEQGLYNANPALFFDQLNMALDHFHAVRSLDQTTNPFLELMKFTGAWAHVPERKKVMEAWIKLKT